MTIYTNRPVCKNYSKKLTNKVLLLTLIIFLSTILPFIPQLITFASTIKPDETQTERTPIPIDPSPPTTPIITDDGRYTNSLNQLHASWSSRDPQTGITEYQYSISTAPGLTNIVNWTSTGLNTEVTHTGLNLTEGQTYYFNVKAKNGAWNWSKIGSSDGIIVDATVPASPTLNSITTPTGDPIQVFSGTKEINTSVWLNNQQITHLTPEITWSYTLNLTSGNNALNIYCKDIANNISPPLNTSIFYDSTPPIQPQVTDDGTYTVSNTQLHAIWSSTDPETNISEYQYSIGTTPASTDVLNWTSAGLNTAATATGLNLTENQTYYLNVKAKNAVNLWSDIGSADGIVVDITAPLISNIFPTQGSVIVEGNPTIQASYSDSIGINVNTANLFLNNENVTALCTITAQSISYTPTEVLDDQTYTAKVIVSDLAGNQSQTIWSFTVYKGSLITPELGGEVSSPDGKAKLIIPAGALTEPTQIRILTLDEEFLNASTPSGYSLIIAAECHPLNLTLNSAVELIFKDTPQIPGTPINLASYNAGQGEFVPTGQTSVVGSDSYTMSFSVAQFLTYGVMISLDLQGTPIGGGIDIPLPDMFTGAFSHTISINVPPGRKGIQPTLKLQYKSSNPNSWVGYGWSLSPGFIMRSTKNGPPTYNDNLDTFIFISDSSGTELTHLVDNLYEAKIESSFAKFYKESDDSWKILQKDGTILEFGKTPNSKEGSGNNTFTWYVTKAKDTNGNYVQFEYDKPAGNKSYLSQVKYTGNEDQGVSPKLTVEFLRQPRTDIISSYISGSEITISERLSEIKAWIEGEANPVWKYVLVYESSPDTSRSLLKTITQYTSDGQPFPTQTFNYQTAE